MAFLTEEGRGRVAEAVAEAEAKTIGEIVTMVVGRSWAYPRAEYLGAILITILATLLVSTIVPLSSAEQVIGVEILCFAGSLFLIKRVPFLKRLFVQKDFMRVCVRRRAVRAFHEHGLNRTRQSTGILIMISLFERDVEILADRGINERVPDGTWDSVVKDLVAGIREGRQEDALVHAVKRVGTLLEEAFPITPGDENELHDHVIFEDE